MAATALVPKIDLPTDWAASDGYLILDDATDGLLDTDEVAPSPFTTTTLTAVVDLAIRRGRAQQFDQMQAGTATVTLNKTATVTADVYRLGQIATIYGTDAGGDTEVFKGVVIRSFETSDPNTGVELVHLSLVDRLRTAQDYDLLPGASPGSTTVETLIEAALSALAGLNDYSASIEASTVSCGEINWTGSVLAAVLAAELADGGVFFYSKAGVFTFLQASTIYDATRYTTAAVAISDAGGTYPVRAIDPSYSVDQVVNQWTLTNANGSVISRQNDASVERNGRRGQSRTVLNDDDTYTATLAQRYADVGAAQDDQWRRIQCHAERGSWAAKIPDLELYDFVEITSPSAVDTVIEGIEHSYTAHAGWVCTLSLNAAVPSVAT